MNLPSSGQSTDTPRRNVLFIRHKKTRIGAEFQTIIEDEWVTVLKQHCDVHVIDQDFDYGAVCDAVNPDFVIFETPGGYRPVPLTITNTRARPDILKIGFQNQDPHDTARVNYARLLDDMQIDRFFANCLATMRQSPEWAARTYTVSMFIDTGVFHDYGLGKDIPVSVFGGFMAPNFYNWRATTLQQIVNLFPTLIYTHPGYEHPIPRHRFPVAGAEYAKMLNRSHFSLSDGTRESYIVRKHLEIAASGAILVSPEFPELGCYGFHDMENCILGSGQALFDKMARAADDPDLYRRICKNGYDLVHARHTSKNWRYITDWYECHRALRPGEVVQQQGIFGPFKAVPGDSRTPALNAAPLADSEFSTEMRKAMQLIVHDNKPDEAATILAVVGNWLGHATEPYVPMALASLLKGEVPRAKDLLLTAYAIRNAREGVTCFDPEELAWLWLTGTILGDADLLKFAGMSGDIRHLGLRRMKALHAAVENKAALAPTPDLLAAKPDDRLSIYWTGQLEWTAWLSLVNRILAANNKAMAA